MFETAVRTSLMTVEDPLSYCSQVSELFSSNKLPNRKDSAKDLQISSLPLLLVLVVAVDGNQKRFDIGSRCKDNVLDGDPLELKLRDGGDRRNLADGAGSHDAMFEVNEVRWLHCCQHCAPQ